MDTGKSIWIQKSSRVIKGLIVSYLVSGAGLLLLALLLLKCQLDEGKVSAGILAVYILMSITVFYGAGTGTGVKGAFLTLLICAGSSTLGAMVAGA